jgi:hypothetical protein
MEILVVRGCCPDEVAEYIVKACNYHPKLVEALRELRGAWERAEETLGMMLDTDGQEIGPSPDVAIGKKARALLAELEGGE